MYLIRLRRIDNLGRSIQKGEDKMKLTIRLFVLLCIMAMLTSCMNKPIKQENVGDPRIIGSAYQGTSDIDIFEALVYHCFASFNKPFFTSMILPISPPQPENNQTTPSLLIPAGMVQLSGISFSTTVDPHYSFPHLPVSAKIKGTISASFPKTDGVQLTVGWPIAEYNGALYIVKPLYTQK